MLGGKKNIDKKDTEPTRCSIISAKKLFSKYLLVTDTTPVYTITANVISLPCRAGRSLQASPALQDLARLEPSDRATM